MSSMILVKNNFTPSTVIRLARSQKYPDLVIFIVYENDFKNVHQEGYDDLIAMKVMKETDYIIFVNIIINVGYRCYRFPNDNLVIPYNETHDVIIETVRGSMDQNVGVYLFQTDRIGSWDNIKVDLQQILDYFVLHMKNASITLEKSIPVKIDVAKCKQCNAELKKIRKCSNCLTALYCGRDCQIKDWPEHKSKCVKVDLKKPLSNLVMKSSKNGKSKIIPISN